MTAALTGHVSTSGAVATVGVAVMAGAALDWWRFTHYRCGVCDRRLEPPRRWWMATRTRETIAFTCATCGIRWETGLNREA